MIDGNGAKSHKQRIREWAAIYAQHKAFCYEHFQDGRADTIIAEAKHMAKVTTLGAIQALDLCMQIEMEFPKRLAEVLDRAREHPNGELVGIAQYIRHLRNTGG